MEGQERFPDHGIRGAVSRFGCVFHLLYPSVPCWSLRQGLSTFHDRIKGRDIVIWSDNAGAEHSMRKGSLFSAEPMDQCPRICCKDPFLKKALEFISYTTFSSFFFNSTPVFCICSWMFVQPLMKVSRGSHISSISTNDRQICGDERVYHR